MDINDTLDIPRKVIDAITTQTKIIGRQKTVNTFFLVILIIVGGCLTISGYIGLLSVGVAVVIFLLGEAIKWYTGLKFPDHKDLRSLRFELFLLFIIALELIIVALAGPDVWVSIF